jgi:hypothetical protein
MTMAAEQTVTRDPTAADVSDKAKAPPDVIANDTAAPANETEKDPAAEERAARKAELDRLAKSASQKYRAKQSLRAREREIQMRAAAQERELAEARAFRERFAKDPLSVAEEHGLTAEQLAERVMKRGSYEEKFEQQQREIASLRAVLEEQRNAAAIARMAATRASAEDAFCSMVAKEEAKYPHLSLLDRDELVEKAHRLAHQAVQAAHRRGHRNYRVDPAELAAWLEKSEAPKFERHRARLSGSASNDNARKPADATGAKAEEKGHGLRGNQAGTPRTLTNGHASERGSKPVAFEDLPDREQNKILAERLRNGWRG